MNKNWRKKIQKNLLTFFLFLWVIFVLLEPDPDCESDPDTEPGTPLSPDPIRIWIWNTGTLLWKKVKTIKSSWNRIHITSWTLPPPTFYDFLKCHIKTFYNKLSFILAKINIPSGGIIPSWMGRRPCTLWYLRRLSSLSPLVSAWPGGAAARLPVDTADTSTCRHGLGLHASSDFWQVTVPVQAPAP